MTQSDAGPDIVKRGYLHIKRPPCGNPKIRLKAWQKKYVILRDISLDNGISTFEIFDCEETYKGCGKPSYKLDLKNVVCVETYNESKRFLNAFMIIRKGQAPLALGCISPIEKHSWMEALRILAEKRGLIYKYKDFDVVSTKVMGNSDRRPSCPGRLNYVTNPLYNAEKQRHPGWANVTDVREPLRSNGPPTTPRTASVDSCGSSDDTTTKEFIYTKCDGVLVHIQPSTDAVRNALSGDYYMNVTGSHITLTSVTSLKEAIRWPISHVQKFKSEDNDKKYQLITLEASLLCGKAHGCFLFQTTHGLDLINKVKDASTKVPSRDIRCTGQMKYTRQIMIKQFSTSSPLLDSYVGELSKSTPDLLNSAMSSFAVKKRQMWIPKKQQGTSDWPASYLELLDHGSSEQVYGQMSLDCSIPEYGDSGFDDSDEDRSLHNDSLDVCIPVSSRRSMFDQDPAPPVPPRSFPNTKTANTR